MNVGERVEGLAGRMVVRYNYERSWSQRWVHV